MNKKTLVPYIVYLVIFVIFCIIRFVSIDESSILLNTSYYFDLISVSSILGGFMFTALSILISISYSDVVKMLEESGHMDSIYFNITFGLIMAFLTIILSIISIFIDLPQRFYLYKFIDFLVDIKNYIIILLVGGCILSFGLSILDLKFIISEIRRKLYNRRSFKENKALFKKITNSDETDNKDNSWLLLSLLS